MSLEVLKPGMLSSFQDLGRHGFQHLGVPVSGALDARSHRLANLLVGNEGTEATLEVTLLGPSLRFDEATCLAICGGDFQATRNGEPLPLNRPVVIRPGDTVALGRARQGGRAYLAVHGGFALEPVMASQSTYLRGHFGGYAGRALRKADRLELAAPLRSRGLKALALALWERRITLPGPVAAVSVPGLRPIRLLRSAQWEAFTLDSRKALLTQPYRIAADSDRMGYRLSGPGLALAQKQEMLSEATTFGAVQVPAGGQPIVLMADRQTTGGYPKIAYVASVDLPRLAQQVPGDTLHFCEIDLTLARRLDADTETAFQTLAQGLADLRTLLLAQRRSG